MPHRLGQFDSTALLGYVDERAGFLSPFSRDFVRRLFANGTEKYKARIAQMGFSNAKRALDAGCGFGQWALAWSETAGTVEGSEIVEGRVFFLNELARRLGVPNLTTSYGDVCALQYPDASFDAILSYGVIFMAPDWRKAVKEYVRLLEPGGKLYICANDVGYYRFAWDTQPNKGAGHDPRRMVAHAFMNAWRREVGLEALETGMTFIPAPELAAELESLGMVDVSVHEEGTYVDPNFGDKPSSFFVGRYKDDLAVYEVLARKP